MTLLILVSLLLQLVALSAYAAGDFDLFRKDFLQGHELLQEGRSDLALPPLLKIRDLDVAMRDYLLHDLAEALAAQGREDEAEEVFRELRKYPKSRWRMPFKERQEEAPPCEGILRDDRKADCLFRSRHYSQAKVLYQKLPPQSFTLIRLSQSAARSQDFATAIEANEKLKTLYPKTDLARQALRKIAILQLDFGNYRKAISVFEEILASSPRATPHERREIFEKIGWCHFRLGEWKESVRSFDRALDEAEAPFSLYWKGRGLESLGRRREARALFRNILVVYPESYYGIRAAEQLHREGSSLRDWWPRIAGGLRWMKGTERIFGSPDLEKIAELHSLGLDSDVMIEALTLREDQVIPPSVDPRKIRKKGDQFLFPIREPRHEDPDYPLPYASFLFEETKRAGIDPLLVYAMMRQESRYREEVVSPAGAIGILQIMPATGEKLALETGWIDYQSRWLTDPVINVDLAVRYLKNLSNLFDKKWYAVAASYNAGEQVVQAWLRQKEGLSEEEFIEEIPYSETRNYVKKVYAHWRAYQAIYGASR